MGTYTSFSVDGYDLISSKSSVSPVLMTLFAEVDKRVRASAQEDEGAPAGDWVLPGIAPAARVDKYGIVQLDHAYVAPVRVVRDRLEVMGFTLPRTIEHYEERRAAEVDVLRSYVAESEAEGEEPWALKDLRALEALTFDAWLAAMQWVKERGAHSLWSQGEIPEGLRGYCISPEDAREDVRFMLKEGDDEHWRRFYATDPRFIVRAVLETCSDDALVVQDISDLVHGEYYDSEDRIAEDARAVLTADYPVNARILVLTEGRTDQQFLEGSLRLLYPHLANYYSFMDFAGMAVPGGAGALVAAVKTFAGVGITNRVVAILDNDAAGRDAARLLAAVSLPTNFRVLTYPPFDAARAWPTCGPTGVFTMDVNGLAGSIELYFGDDVLRRNGDLAPVKWGGPIAGIGAYQGELLDKFELQQRFRDKLERASKDATLVETLDWSGMRSILDALRRAFQ
jgi:hypothetical protein